MTRYATATDAMVAIVTAAGGAAVIAHPWGRGSRHVLDEETLVDLQLVGLVGIEVEHQDHDAGDRRTLRAMAERLDLVATGSSDYHGTGKVDHDLGCNITSVEQYDRLLARAAANASRSGRRVAEVV